MILYQDVWVELVTHRLEQIGFQWVQQEHNLPDEWPKGMGALVYQDLLFGLHIHVLPGDHPVVATNRAFRDQLRTDPALVAAYVACKQSAIAHGITDPIAYTQAKRPFIETAMDNR